MNKIITFLFVLVTILIFSPKVTFAYTEADPAACAAANHTCTSVNVSFSSASNWPGGSVEVRCKGGQDAGLSVPCCIGESATLKPGESATLNKCDCKVGGSACVEIVKKEGNAESCNLSVGGGSCGGTNGKDEITPSFISGSCGGNPGGGNPGGGNPGGGNPGGGNPGGGNPGKGTPKENQCSCTYEESCTKNGKEGTRTCHGQGSGNSCSFAGESCAADCSECEVPDEEKPEETPPPTQNRCDQPCDDDKYCVDQGGDNDCTKCLPNKNGEGKTCQPPPNRCNQPCENDQYCVSQGGTDNCTKCLPNKSGEGKTCQPPPTNRCNQPCDTDQYCDSFGGTDNCTKCLPLSNGKGKACQPPPKTPPSTPKPVFSPVMCKCDGVSIGDGVDTKTQVILPGSRAKITAMSYVSGLDTKLAEVRDVTFTLVEANGTVGTVLRKSDPIKASTTNAQVVSSSVNRVNYSATWDVDIPEGLKKGSIYRIFANTNCVKKRVAALDFINTGVLGESDQATDQSFFAGVSNWIQTLFGIRPNEDTPPAPKSESTPQPNQNNEELKLKTVQPALVLNKACTSITFQVK